MGAGDLTLTRDEFLEWTNGVWNFNGGSKKRIGHPAPFPVELSRRGIKLFSFRSLSWQWESVNGLRLKQ